ncbi:phage major capsid protein [Nocardioides sp. URHA0020]|uniref:phage major capsid protein n=1 Tax=Nocardioides sp. URHA0020 TaxID=1380392 RepID=UPI000491D84E|nr:phage major capsid protein [Nocardioides sp. URHA0020]
MTTSRSVPASLPTAADLERVRNELEPRAVRADEAARLKTQVMDFMNHTLENAHGANGTLMASELRTYNKAEKLYDELTGIHDANVTIRPKSEGWATGPDSRDQAPYAEGKPLAKGQTFDGYIRAMGYTEPPEIRDALDDAGRGELSLARFVRGVFQNEWDGAEPERLASLGAPRTTGAPIDAPMNTLSGASAGAGGVMLPTILAARIVELARKQTRVMRAGATTVVMTNRKLDVPRWLTDPTMSWRAENAAIASSDPTMDVISLVAKTLAAYTKVSRELVEDTEIEAQLESAFAASLALSIDLAALYGAGTSVEPKGIKTDANVTKTSLATNGATPTWDNLVDAVGRLRDQNEEPNAQIMADRTLRSLSKAKESGTGAYITPPTYLDGIDRLTTNQVPVNLTVGTSNDTSDVFTGSFDQLLIGLRTGLQITLLEERFMDSEGAYALVAWWRGDMAVARPKAFDVTTGVRP